MNNIDWTQVIIHGLGIIASYFFGKRRGQVKRMPPLEAKDLKDIDGV